MFGRAASGLRHYIALKYDKNMARLGKVESSSPFGARKFIYIYIMMFFWLISIPVRRGFFTCSW